MTPQGFRYAAVEAAIKKPGRLDLALLWCDAQASLAGVFTRNRVCAAPVQLCRERLSGGTARAVLVNAGNANACTGAAGLADARRLAQRTAELCDVPEPEVLPCSTGVIGLRLPVERIEAALPDLRAALGPDPDPFARAILTTDTFPKLARRELRLGGQVVNVLGIAKGAGMIHPDMATMLAYLVTDADVPAGLLQGLLNEAVATTFNRVTVDGDTSTNDTVLALASRLAGPPVVEGGPEHAALGETFGGVCRDLARMIVRDGEGATKVVDVRVSGAASEAAALAIARTVAGSPLVKTALHGADPNWGRIAGALGRTPEWGGGGFDISIGGVPVVRDGLGLGTAAEGRARQAMLGDAFEIWIAVHEGHGEATVTTCDLTADYVRINADYRS